MASFVPPTDDLLSLADHRVEHTWDIGVRFAFRLFRFYDPLPVGRNVFKLNDGSYIEYDPAEMSNVVATYYGGHRTPVSAAEVASLTAAGYGDYIVEDTFVGSGAGAGSSTGFATGTGFSVLLADATGNGTGSSSATSVHFSVLSASATGNGAGTSSTVQQVVFSPLSLSPVLWLDASDTSTITESGGSVSQWDDKSPEGRDFVQGTAALQPTTGTRTLNGLNVIDFDGSNDRLTNSTTDWGANIAIFAVVQVDALGSNAIFEATSTYIFTSAHGVRMDMWADHRMGISSDGSGSFAKSADSTNPTIQVGTYDGTTIKLRINGTQTASSVAESGDISYTGVTQTVLGYIPSTAAVLNGILAEVIIVDNALTADQISDCETYLANKWGITI